MIKKGTREKFSGRWIGLIAFALLMLAPLTIFTFLFFVCSSLPGHCSDDTASFGTIISVALKEKGLHGRATLFVSTLLIFLIISPALFSPVSRLIIPDLEINSQPGKCSNSSYWTADAYQGFETDESKLSRMEYFISGGRPLVGLSGNSENLWNQRGRDFSEISDLDCIELITLHGNASNYSELSKLKNLKVLRMSISDFSDSTPLNELGKIEYLDLSNTQISDISFAANMLNLKYLSINNTPVSDISALEGLENLEIVELHNTNVTDLSPLKSMKNLKTVTVHASQISKPHCLEVASTTPNKEAFYCPE